MSARACGAGTDRTAVGMRRPAGAVIALARLACAVGLAALGAAAVPAAAADAAVPAPATVAIPAGPFLAGSTPAAREAAYRLDEAA